MRLIQKHLFWLKVVIHLVATTPIGYLLLLVINDKAGGDPVQYIIHYTGIGALNTLVMLLTVSPVAKQLKQGVLIQTRRLIGLYVFFYASLHILAFVSLDLLFEWSLFFEEVIKRPYIIVGGVGYIILMLLAVTSFKQVKKKMGKKWQHLHNFVYVLAVLIPIHFFWSVKSEIIEPSLYFLIMAILLYFRVPQFKKWLKWLVNFKFNISNG